ncbi:MAG: ERF family protein, partial [Clostridia bacterium]|nr:ERF family protein [Clostridia bacterium]
VFLTDHLVQVGERYYIEAEAIFCDLETEQNLSARGYAREDETKKGMDGSQITGASSSYARKYALNGLFDIDDNQDSDSTNIQPVETSKPVKPARERLIAKLHEKGIDINTYAKEHNLTSQSTTEDFERLLAELEG